MNWVSPIKEDTTLEKFKERLRETDDKYYIMFEIGIGTGLQLQDILSFKNKDICGKDEITVTIGTKNMKRKFQISPNLKNIITKFTEGKDPDAYLITGHASSSQALSREQAYRVFKSAGKSIGLSSIGAQTMRKTFAWRYYQETNDIYYLQSLFNHASPSITYRYIGEKPNVEISLKKLTPEENERSRKVLCTDDNGKKRLQSLIDDLSSIRQGLDTPTNNDAYFGRVECVLDELETLMNHFKNL